MTVADWCSENGIAVSNFYNGVSRCRKTAADQSSPPNYGHLKVPHPKQDVVSIDIVPDHIPKQNTVSQIQKLSLDNVHTVEAYRKDNTIRINNDADPVRVTRTLHLFREFSCQVISPVSKRFILYAATTICVNSLIVLFRYRISV